MQNQWWGGFLGHREAAELLDDVPLRGLEDPHFHVNAADLRPPAVPGMHCGHHCRGGATSGEAADSRWASAPGRRRRSEQPIAREFGGVTPIRECDGWRPSPAQPAAAVSSLPACPTPVPGLGHLRARVVGLISQAEAGMPGADPEVVAGGSRVTEPIAKLYQGVREALS